jgi:hypothetical protein
LIFKEGDACVRGRVLAGQKTNNRIVGKKSGEGDGLRKLAKTDIESGNVTLIL